MFGYIRPQKEELKVKEYELYRAVYCGLCKTMGKRYAHSFRVTLSYDYTFLVLLWHYLTGETASFEKKRCFAHPTKKKVMMKSNSAIERASDVAAILLQNNLKDKVSDRDKSSFKARLGLPFAKSYRKKAIKKYGAGPLDVFISEKLKELSEAEKSGDISLDRAAFASGEILSECAAYGLTDEKQRRIAKEIGTHIGRVIYILDAVDDIDDDYEKKHFNPLLSLYKTPEEAKKHREIIETTVRMDLKTASEALSLADAGDPGIKAILDNAFGGGILKIQDDIFKERKYYE